MLKMEIAIDVLIAGENDVVNECSALYSFLKVVSTKLYG